MKNKKRLILFVSAIVIGSLASSALAQSGSSTQKPEAGKIASDKSSGARGVGGESQDTGERAAIEILEKNAAAIGGSAALAAIKWIDLSAERLVLGRTLKSRRIDDLAGKRVYQKQDSGDGGIIELGFDGQRAWQKSSYFRGYLEESSIYAKSLKRVGIRLPGFALYDYKTGSRKFSRLPDEQFGGKNYFVLSSIATDENGKVTKAKYYLDPATYLLKQTVTGDAVTQTEIFDDYRKVEGLTISYASTIVNPQATLASKIVELKFNAPVDASIFEYKEGATTDTTKGSGGSGAALPTDSPKQSGGEISESLRLQTFERVWKLVNDTFYDRAFNNVDWQAVHKRYLPLAKTTARSDEFHKLLDQMVGELHLSHFKVSPPDAVLTLNSTAAELKNGSIGLSVKWIANQMLITGVKKDSPAALAGIKPGFVLNRINGKTPDELYADYKKNNPNFQFKEELARSRAISPELAGKPETKVSLELTGADENPLNLELLRKAQPPGRQLEFESKKLAGNIGYIRFNSFIGDLISKFQTALGELRDTKALVVDLRGNGGGAGDLSRALAGLLCESSGSLGALKYRYETQQYSYEGSGAQAYKGEIVLLVDEGTASTSEIFANGLRAVKRAVVVGSRSAGAALPSLLELLPTGGALQYVVSSFQTQNGIVLEGNGVTPDINIRPTRRGISAGRDEVIERATSFIG